MRGLSNLPFFRKSAPTPPPKDPPKPVISPPQNLEYRGGKSAQGGIIYLKHNPHPPHLRPSIPAGPHNEPVRPASDGHDLSHMNLSANSSSASLAESIGKPLPPLPGRTHTDAPPSLHGSTADSQARGTAPWLRPDSPAGAAGSGSMIPGALLREGSGASRGSLTGAEARQVDGFWKALDRHVDARLGPGDEHDMHDLLRATNTPMFRNIVERHPAVGGLHGVPGLPGIPREFREASRPPARPAGSPQPHTTDSAPHGSMLPPAQDGTGSDPRALWREMRRQAAEAKRVGGEPDMRP